MNIVSHAFIYGCNLYRCAMAPNIYMYDRTSSAGVEAMHNANRPVREKTAVDPCNAILLIVELECDIRKTMPPHGSSG